MSTGIRAVTVHMDRTAAAANRAILAADLADRFGAQISGAAAGIVYLPSYAPFGDSFIALQPEIVETAHKLIASALDDAAAVFRTSVKMPGAIWRQSQATDAASFLGLIARTADLIVVGRPVETDIDASLGLRPSDLVMTAGRPILVAPTGADRLSAARIVVGWKDSCESRRAVADAMPILTKADEVFVVAADAEDGGKGAAEVAAWLGAHGAQAKSIVESVSDARAAEALMTVAKRVNADLIVAGAFGHSRAREWIFGGVTRSLLKDTEIAVLLSH